MTEKQRAFTLVELLIVIAIITILAALLMPALLRSRKLARAVLCVNRYKQIGTLIQMFADDADGRHPGNAHRVSPSATQEPFHVFAYGYVYDTLGYNALSAKGTPRDLNCSEIAHHATMKNDQGYSLTNFGMNQDLTGYHVRPDNWGTIERVRAYDNPTHFPAPQYTYWYGTRLSLVSNPDTFVDACDYTNLFTNWYARTGFLKGGYDAYGIINLQWNKYDECWQMSGSGVTFRHLRRGTVLYVDGHVSTEPPNDELNERARWKIK